MDAYFSKEVLEGIRRAQDKAMAKQSRLRIHTDDKIYPVLRSWPGGFSLKIEDAPNLRGFIDFYDGSRHLAKCLIIYSAREGAEMIYEYKWHTSVGDPKPVDFVIDPEAPVALLT